MKRSFILFPIAVAFCCPLGAQTVSNVISFEEKVCNFGEISESKGKVSHTFVFWNRGKMPVAIDDVASGCGCTTADYTKEPVRAGGKGKVTITYNPQYRPGFFSKEVVVFSNNRKNINRVWIKGDVIPYRHPVEEDYPYAWGNGLYTNLKVLAFGKIAKGVSKQIKLCYANNTNKPMILKFVVESRNSDLKFMNPEKIAPMKRGQMIVTYTMTKALRGEMAVNIYPVVNGKKLSQPLRAKISGIE